MSTQVALPPAPELVGHPAIVELGPLDSDQRRLLAILLNPANDENGFTDNTESEYDMADWFEDNFYGYAGMDTYQEAQQVADLLRTHYLREATRLGDDDGGGRFTFGLEADCDGTISGFTVGVYTGYSDEGGYLLTAGEVKHLTWRRDARGLEAALGYAEALDEGYQRMLRKARRVGLVPTVERAATDRALGDVLRDRLVPASLPNAAARERDFVINQVLTTLRSLGIDTTTMPSGPTDAPANA